MQADIQFEKTEKGGRYFVVMPNGEESRLTFVNAGDHHIIADHTFVPPGFRDGGTAVALVDRLFADARANGLKITPTCWYVAKQFDRRSPEWDDIRA